MKQAVRDPRELCRILELPAELEGPAVRAARLFPLFAPRSYVARIERGNPDDPLLRQILPLDAEFESPEGFSDDPVGDLGAAIAPGLLHKYHGRVLMVTTGACAVHCRYCFRRPSEGACPFCCADHRTCARQFLQDSLLLFPGRTRGLLWGHHQSVWPGS